jgi:hypothetical protein
MSGTSFDERALVCPACRARLRLAAPRNVVECTGCGRIYPVREGIPVLLIEEATQPDSSTAARK